MRLKVKSQIHDSEALKKGILDDCGPASTACAIGWVTAYTVEPTVTALVSDYARLFGRVDVQGESSAGTTFQQNINAARAYGCKGAWPKSWDQVVKAAKAGAAIILNVQGPKGYPKNAFTAWAARHEKLKPGSTYGHYVLIAYCADHGWQMADPTGTGKGKETYGFAITEEDFLAMAKGKGRAPHTTCIIITGKPKAIPQQTPLVPPKGKEPLAPASAPVALMPVPAPKPIVAAIRRIIDRRFGRVAK